MESLDFVFALIVGGFAGIALLAMLGRWIYALVAAVRSYQAGTDAGGSTSAWSVIAAGLLHSGPWTLAVASYLSYYVLSQPHAAWWRWFFGGACIGPLLIVAVTLRAARRGKQSREEPYSPLTPEALNLERKRFVRQTTLLYGCALTVAMMTAFWRMPELVVIVLPLSMGGGYVFALIMWEWKKSILQTEDYQRRKAQGGG